MSSTDHDADVAAVLAEALCVKHESPQPCSLAALYGKPMLHPECILAALTAANYAVMKLPEGVAVGHGARLVPIRRSGFKNGYFVRPPRTEP